MKRKLMFLIFLIALAALGLFVHVYVFSKSSSNSGNLVVYASPDGTVFVNSKAEGRTPFSMGLAPGIYTVKIIPNSLDPQRAKNAVPWQGKVQIFAKADTYVRRELASTDNESGGEIITLQKSQSAQDEGKGEVDVKSIPEGAIISIDGTDMGVSPDTFTNVSQGVHDLSVYLARFKRRSVQIQVVPGFRTSAEFSLGVDTEFEKKYPFGALIEASASAKTTLPSVPKTTREPTPTSIPEKVLILETPTGFLRVRSDPSLAGKEVSQVKPGESYPYVSSENGWVKIKLTGGDEGWVSGDYVKEVR